MPPGLSAGCVSLNKRVKFGTLIWEQRFFPQMLLRKKYDSFETIKEIPFYTLHFVNKTGIRMYIPFFRGAKLHLQSDTHIMTTK